MDSPDTLEDATLLQRVVLLGLVSLQEQSETPASSDQIRSVCNDCETKASDEVVGRVSEPDVIRALNRLVDRGAVDERPPSSTSPVGKGRPNYDLAIEPDPVLGVLSSDDRLEALLDAAPISE
ncbi:MAG: hypothetical protein V5A46_01760 [Haloferacaceae archaeon]